MRDIEAVAALRHQILSAATPGGVKRIEIEASPSILIQAACDVAGMLLKTAAQARGETEDELASMIHADLLLRELDGG